MVVLNQRLQRRGSAPREAVKRPMEMSMANVNLIKNAVTGAARAAERVAGSVGGAARNAALNSAAPGSHARMAAQAMPMRKDGARIGTSGLAPRGRKVLGPLGGVNAAEPIARQAYAATVSDYSEELHQNFVSSGSSQSSDAGHFSEPFQHIPRPSSSGSGSGSADEQSASNGDASGNSDFWRRAGTSVSGASSVNNDPLDNDNDQDDGYQNNDPRHHQQATGAARAAKDRVKPDDYKNPEAMQRHSGRTIAELVRHIGTAVNQASRPC